MHQCILQSYATFKFDSLVSACQVRPGNWGYRFTQLITAENADRFDVKYSWKTEYATQLLCFLLQYWILSERKTRFAVSLFSQETRAKRSLDCQNSQTWGNIVHCHRQNSCLLAKTAKQSFFLRIQVRASSQTKCLERGWKRRPTLGRDAKKIAYSAFIIFLQITCFFQPWAITTG